MVLSEQDDKEVRRNCVAASVGSGIIIARSTVGDLELVRSRFQSRSGEH